MKTPSSPSLTIGIDLGSRSHAICVIDADSEVIDQRSIGSDRLALSALSEKYPSALIVMEVGMVSPWTSRFFQQHGHRVIIAPPCALKRPMTWAPIWDSCPTTAIGR